MTNEQRAEIERLAANLHEKSEMYRCLGMTNRPTDPDADRAASVRYRMAETEWIAATAALQAAQDRIVEAAGRGVLTGSNEPKLVLQMVKTAAP